MCIGNARFFSSFVGLVRWRAWEYSFIGGPSRTSNSRSSVCSPVHCRKQVFVISLEAFFSLDSANALNWP